MIASTPQTRSRPPKVSDVALPRLRVGPSARVVRKMSLQPSAEQLGDRRVVLETPIDPRQARRASFHRRRLAQNSATKKPLADGLVFVSKAGNKPSKDG